MPILNAGGFLRERMETIMSQTYTDWELIVSDNFSDDGSWELLQEYAQDPRVTLFQSPREGMYQNWNTCLERVRGEYVYIATADDTMSPEFLEKTVGALESVKNVESGQWTVDSNLDDADLPRSTLHTPQSTLHSPRPVDLCVCRHERIDEEGHCQERRHSGIDDFLGQWSDEPHVRSGFTEFLLTMVVACHWDTLTAVVFRSRLLEKTGMFRTDCGNAADRCWRWKAMLGSDLVYLPDYLATWRVHEEQSTAKTIVDPRHTHLVHQLARETLDECESAIPELWRGKPNWRETLLHHFWVEYVRGYGVDRAMLRSKPGSFAKGAFRALLREPKYLLHRLVCGLSWDDPLFEDEIVRLRRLIKEWNVPWPPQPLDL